ncbi:MAG TPA: SRPBCC domain-containing protein, partial [Phenylobacterium sp.]|nr:SRPBCC domain-containing protein [Phenylobacterium sp.]
FDAWLDPKLAVRFLGAGGSQVSEFASDAQVGGEFRLVMSFPDRHVVHEGRYVAIERPNRLVFTWISLGTDERLSLVSVTFTPTTQGVRVDLEHEGLPDAERAANHEYGWGTILAQLQTALA